MLTHSPQYKALLNAFQNNHVFAHTHMHDLFRKWLEAAT